MTKRDDIDTVISANKELLTVLDKVKECFSLISLAQNEATKTSNEFGAQLADTGEKVMANAEKSAGAIKNEITLLGAFGEAFAFLFQKKENYDKAQEDSWEKFYGKDGLSKKHEREFTAMRGINELYEASVNSLSAVQASAYGAMEDQMLSLIETGKFSVGAMGKVIAMQVKMELVGLAAKAAVWAIFETAMGFATWGTPMSAAHFKSAATFGLVAGASLAAASGVNSLLGKPKDSSSGAGSVRGGSLFAYPAPMREEVKPTQNITLQIYNPLSQQNWAEITENNILPALKAASDMNIVMNVKTVYA